MDQTALLRGKKSIGRPRRRTKTITVSARQAKTSDAVLRPPSINSFLHVIWKEVTIDLNTIKRGSINGRNDCIDIVCGEMRPKLLAPTFQDMNRQVVAHRDYFSQNLRCAPHPNRQRVGS